MAENHDVETEQPLSKWAMIMWGGFYGSGIIGSLLLYGVLQERIMAEPYGNEMFGISIFLVFFNRCVAVVFAFTMIIIKREQFKWAAPLWKYGAISLSNVGASWCQYEALKFVSFPVQMLGKSFKMMPVMIWGMIISQKRYSLQEWCVAACITGGVTEFLLTGSIAAKHKHGTSVRGIVLLLVFLGLDGFTSTFQEKLFKAHKTTKYNQMLYVNLWSTIVSVITLFASRKMALAWAFGFRHPVFFADAIALSAAAVSGQWFIYSQVKEFGALVFAATMNVRQVVSILVSYATYHHPIKGWQILGLIIVFAALFYKSAMAFMSPSKPKGEEPTPEEKAPLLPDAKKLAEAKV
jgi:adenosine 3'-phospho 5'-phosphosulfate transporter B2